MGNVKKAYRWLLPVLPITTVLPTASAPIPDNWRNCFNKYYLLRMWDSISEAASWRECLQGKALSMKSWIKEISCCFLLNIHLGSLQNFTSNLTHFQPVFHFYAPWKHQKTSGFLMFSGGIEIEHWLKMD